MRKPTGYLISLIAMLIGAGCASQIVFIYPKLDHTNIFVSPDTVSTWTEIAAQDYLIPNSQVFITGQGSDAAKYFGLLGVAINRSQNASTVAIAENGLRMNFSADLARVLSARISSRSLSGKFGVVETPDLANAKLLPSATLTVSTNNSARLSFRFTVRFIDAITNSEVKKEYYYIHGSGKPLAGPNSWSDANAKSLRTTTEELMPQLADVLLDDMAGSFSGAFDQDKQRFINYTVVGGSEKAARALLLREYPGHLVVAPILGERPLKNLVVVLERQSIELHGI